MSDLGKTRIHCHVFFENETFVSWISLTSWLFILIFRAESGNKNDSMSFLTKNENSVRKIEFVTFINIIRILGDLDFFVFAMLLDFGVWWRMGLGK